MTAKDCDPLIIDKVLTAATEVHRILGPGLLESVYERALASELRAKGLSVRSQVEVTVIYKGADLGIGFRADLLVEDCLVLELKSINNIDDSHIKQLVTYLKMMKIRRGYILNFNNALLKRGIKRVSV